MKARPKVLIVGGGIGGLTAAIALRQAGFPVDVFERAPQLKELGAGIGLSANATRVLKHLGLLDQIIEKATVLKATLVCDWRGTTLLRMPLNNSADVPSVCLHRADLQQALYSALPPTRCEGPVTLRLTGAADGCNCGRRR